MVLILGQDIGFWTAFVAGIFILLHLPSCSEHWAYRLLPFSRYLRKYHNLTLALATLFAFAHVVLSLVGLITGVWI